MSKDTRSLERAIGFIGFAEQLSNAREIERAIGEMFDIDRSTQTKMRPIHQKLTKQIKQADRRLKNICRVLSEMSPNCDREEFDEAFAELEECVANLQEHFLKVAATLHSAMMELMQLSLRRKRAARSRSGRN